ncbi:hypothetical protein, partial [Escherichia coli]|uniref:hypothetical protein n=1 Tax=Escherichia coli TaxID=562 RepID=UPI00137ACEA3
YAGAAFLTPFIVLNTAARIAPRFKFATAVALAVAFGVGYVYIYMQVYEEIQAGIYDTERYVKLAVNAVLQIVGVSAGLIVVHRKIYRSSSHDLE